MDKILNPIFIIGQHRTGSTLIKNILDRSKDVKMAIGSPNILNPWRNDFIDYYNSYNLKNQPSKLSSLIEDNKIPGSFWRRIGENKEQVNNLLKGVNSFQGNSLEMLNLLFSNQLLLSGKKRFGVKHPLHYSEINKLNEWYDDCKIIHLVRNPFSMCASKMNDNATKGRRSLFLFGPFLHYITLLFFIYEFLLSAKINKRHNSDSNYLLVRFEDIIDKPDYTILKICKFLQIDFNDKMKNTVGKPSSFSNSKRTKIDTKVLSRWKKSLRSFDKRIIESFVKGASMNLGYKFR